MQVGSRDITVVISANIAGLTKGIATAKRQVSTMSSSMMSAGAGMSQRMSESMRRMGNTMVGAAGAALVGFVYPVVNGLKSIVEAGKGAEDSIQRVMSVFNDIETPQIFKQMKADLEGFISSLAGTTKYDFTQISESMYTMAQSGKDYNEIMSLTPDILQLATAQMAELDSTAQLTISTLNGYEMGMEQSSRVTNALAAATTNTMLRLDDLTVSSRYVNATLGSLWGEEVFERGLALTGMLRNWGRTGMQSGRIIRDVFQSLLNPTAEVERIMENNNIQIYTNSDAIAAMKVQYKDAAKLLDEMTASGEATDDELVNQKLLVDDLGYSLENTYATGLKDIDEVLSQFAKAREAGMTQGEMFAIGGKQSGGAFTQIVDNIDTYTELTAAITGTNEAERQYEVQTQTLAYQLEILRSTVVEIKRQLYESIKEPMMDIVKTIIASKDEFVEFGAAFVSGIVEKLKTVIEVFINIVKWFNNLNSGTKDAVTGFIAFASTTAMVLAPLTLLGGILLWNVAALLSLPQPIYNNVSALVTYVKSLFIVNAESTGLNYALFKLRASFVATRKSVFTSNGVLTAFRNKLLLAKTSVITFGKTLVMAAKNPSLAFKAVLGKLNGGINAFTTGLQKSIVAMVKWAAAMLRSVVTTIIAATITFAPLVLAMMAVSVAAGILFVAIRDNWGGLKDIFDSTIGYILNLIKPFTDALMNVVGTIVGLFSVLKEGTTVDLVGAIGAVFGSIARLVLSIPFTIAKALGDIIGKVASIFSTWFGEIGREISRIGLWEFIKNIVKGIVDAAWSLGKTFIDGFLGGLTGASTGQGQEIIDGLISKDDASGAGSEDGEAYAEGFDTAVENYDFEGIKNALTSSGSGVDLFGDFVSFTDGISEGEKTLLSVGQKLSKQFGEDLPEGLKEQMEAALEDKDAVNILLDWIQENVPEFADEISTSYNEELESAVEDTQNEQYGRSVDLVKNIIDFGVMNSEKTALIQAVAEFLDATGGELSTVYSKFDLSAYLKTVNPTKLGIAAETITGEIAKETELELAIELAKFDVDIQAAVEKVDAQKAKFADTLSRLSITDEDLAVLSDPKTNALENKIADLWSGDWKDEWESDIASGKITEGKTLLQFLSDRRQTLIDLVRENQLYFDELGVLQAEVESEKQKKAEFTGEPAEGEEVTAVTQTGKIVEDNVNEAQTIIKSKAPETGKKLVEQLSVGVTLAQPTFDAVIDSIYTKVETTMEMMITNAFTWGEQFIQSLVSGLQSSMPSFDSAINYILENIKRVQYFVSPKQTANKDIVDAVTNLSRTMQFYGGSTSSKTPSIEINITGTEIVDGCSAEEFAAIIAETVEAAFTKYERGTSIR